jgi:prepilin-type N-terminal cleavage/methylation domain-containing protein
MHITSLLPKQRLAGYTLMELLVTTAISSMLLLAVGALSIYSGRSLTSLSNYANLESQSRESLDQMTREIRQAQELIEYSPTSITLLDTDSQPLQYVYNAEQKQLKRIKGTEQKVLLVDCDYVKFSIYQRNITNGTYAQYVASGTNTCKLIELNWGCSRPILGGRVNTESIQSAKVVMRKKRSEAIPHLSP